MILSEEKSYFPIEALHWAGMQDKDLPNLKKILDIYPDYINVRNKFEDTLLTIAAREGNLKIVQYLVEEKNMNVNQNTPDGNALIVSLKKQHHDVVEYFLNKDIDINTTNHLGENYLFLSVPLGSYKILSKLVEKNINFNHLNHNNENILFKFFTTCTEHKNYPCFELLLENINPNIVIKHNNKGETIFEFLEHKIQYYEMKTPPIHDDLIKFYKLCLFLLKSDFL